MRRWLTSRLVAKAGFLVASRPIPNVIKATHCRTSKRSQRPVTCCPIATLAPLRVFAEYGYAADTPIKVRMDFLV